MRVLYVSYDGVLEPLGESQVVTYLQRLAADHQIALISFEKSEDLASRSRLAAMEQHLAACGIAWSCLRYHRSPPVISTTLDIVRGVARARALCRAGAVQLIHARGYVPALIALLARRVSRARFLFDMRGFWPDEKVEAGHWRAGGLLYRAVKWCERRFFRSADAVVSLTAAGARTLSELDEDAPNGVPVEVIPTCVDLQRFRPAPKDSELTARLGLEGALVVGCVGTMSNWYMRHEMLQYLAFLSRSLENVRVLVVTREDHDALRRDAQRSGVPLNRFVVTRGEFADMPRFLPLFDAGVFFIRPTRSKRGSAATKLAEFLACGVPVVINDGVGDSGAIVTRHRVGVVLAALDPGSFARSLPDVRTMLADPAMGDRCRRTAAELFDVEQAVERYRRLYGQLLERR